MNADSLAQGLASTPLKEAGLADSPAGRSSARSRSSPASRTAWSCDMSVPWDRSLKGDDPVPIVRNEIRRHCLGSDFPSVPPAQLSRVTERATSKGTGTDVALAGFLDGTWRQVLDIEIGNRRLLCRNFLVPA